MSQGDGKPQQTTQRAASTVKQIGSYRLMERIGSGGMGSVFKAVHVGLDRLVALKLLPTDYARNPRLLARFQREAKAAAALEHSNIVAIHDQGEVNGICYIAMEYVEGEDLADRIERLGRLSTRESVEIVKQVAQALGHAHQRGIIHRDIKPSNILIRAHDGVVKLADMGLAHRTRDDRTEAQVTRDGTTVGTVDYMAPEQARDSKLADARSDLYALGCTWYHMLTGHPPFPEGTIIEKLLHHSQDEPPSARKLNSAITESMEAILKRLLKKSPANRYQGVGELLADLENVSFETKTKPYAFETLAESGITLADDVVPIPLAPLTEDEGPPRRRPTTASPRQQAAGPVPAARPIPGKRSASRRRARGNARAPFPLAKVLGALAGVLVLAVVAVFLFAPSKESIPSSEVPKTVDSPSSAISQNAVASNSAPISFPSRKAPLPVYRNTPSRPDFAAPWLESAFVTSPPVVGRVSRGPSDEKQHFESLAAAVEALSATGGTLEIADNGPLFESGFALREKGNVVIRAAEGFEPIVVFEPRSADASALIDADRTDVRLEGIHFVAQTAETTSNASPALVNIRHGDLLARRCTFSLPAGDGDSPTWAVIRVADPRSRSDRTPAGQTHLALDSCFLRGSAASGLSLGLDSGDVVIRNSLLVLATGTVLSWQQPESPTADSVCTLRVLSSTLVSGREVFGLHPTAQGEVPTATRFFVADSVLSCPLADSSARLLHLENWPQASDGRLRNVTWETDNVFYAGWSELVSNTGAGRLSVQNLGQWAQLWQQTSEARQQLARAIWPSSAIGDPCREPAASFDASSLGRALVQGLQSESLGAATESLPQPRDDWFQRSVARWEPVPRPEQLTADQKRAAGPGLFDPALERGREQQERRAEVQIRAARRNGQPPPLAPGANLVVNAEQQDVGAAIASAGLADGSLVAVTGSGQHATSPIRVADRSLRLQFISTGGSELVLTPSDAESPALIEVVDGTLEIEGAAFRLDGHAKAHPRWLARVVGGNLVVKRCRMWGPLGDGSPLEAFVRWERSSKPIGQGRATGEDQPPLYKRYCLVTDCFFVGGSRLIDAEMAGRAMFLENNVFVAPKDVLRVAMNGDLGDFGAYVELTQNTFCALGGGIFLDAPSASNAGVSSPGLRILAKRNLFCKAFDLAPESPSLLRYHAADLHRGLLAWQGDSNAYSNVARYLEPAGVSGVPPVQDFREAWVRTWGGSHSAAFSVGLSAQFEASSFRAGRSMPADFARGGSSEVPPDTGADVSRLATPVDLPSGH